MQWPFPESARTPARVTRTLRDGSLGVALSQALRARLRSHRPSRTIPNSLVQLFGDTVTPLAKISVKRRAPRSLTE